MADLVSPNLPQNLEAEMAFLGAVLVNNKAGYDAAEFLIADHFYYPVHGRIWDAIKTITGRGHVATPVTLKTYFDGDDALEKVGGAKYLAKLAFEAVSIIHSTDYARTVHDLARRRALYDLAGEIRERAIDPSIELTAEELVESAEHDLFAIAESQVNGRVFEIGDLIDGAIKRVEDAKRAGGVVGVKTGLRALDQLIGAMEPGALIFLAGRPSMGKTALGLTIIRRAARVGHKAMLFTLESGGEQIGARVVSQASGVAVSDMRRGDVDADGFERLVAAARDERDASFVVDDTPALSVAGIRSRARRQKRRHGLDLVVVDHMGLVKPDRSAANDRKVYQVEQVTNDLKAAAKSLGLPILVLHQLSRATEHRDDKRPTLADLRDGGSIEQDADVVMLIYRHEYYLRSGPAPGATDKQTTAYYSELNASRGMCDVIVAKNRDGPTATARLRFDKTVMSFRDMSDPDPLADERAFDL